MPRIKTRASLKTIKTFDRTQSLAQKTKEGVQSLNREAENTQSENYESSNAYAHGKLEGAERGVADSAVYGSIRFTRYGMKRGQQELVKSIRRHKVNKGTNNKKPKRLKMSKKKNPVKTADNVKQTTKHTKKAVETTVKTSKKVAEATKKAVEYTAKAIKVSVKAVVSALKTVVAAVKGIVSAIVAGGWIAVLIIAIIVIAGLVIGSVVSIFVAQEGDETPLYIVQTLDREFLGERDKLISERMYDTYECRGKQADNNEVIAVYLVKVNFDKGSRDPAVIMTEENKAMLRGVYYDMNKLETAIEERREWERVVTVDENRKEVVTYEEKIATCLVVTIKSYSPEEMADIYGFTTEQRETLHAILYEALPAW